MYQQSLDNSISTLTLLSLQANPVIHKTVNATMGYKGIITNHLPTSTVTIEASVDVGGGGKQEHNFNFR
jgi:hypothetical protein